MKKPWRPSMARPPAIEKMLFYPTDSEKDLHNPVTNAILSHLIPAKRRSNVLDPCMGKAVALKLAGDAMNCETYGVEISFSRYAIAEKIVDHSMLTAWGKDYL